MRTTVCAASLLLLAICGAAAAAQLKAPSEIRITVPNYELKTVDGGQLAEIPGGEVSYEYAKPMLPVYSVTAAYPRGVVVQDVTLESRAKPEFIKGLKLAVYDPKEAQAKILKALLPRKPAGSWYPEREFEWFLDENPDGSTVLRIGVYPLRYREESGEGEFCRNYVFRVSTEKSQIGITALTVQEASQGRHRMDLLLSNKGQRTDLAVCSIVRAEDAGKPTLGLPLRLLRDLAAEGSYSVEFDTGKLQPGIYRLETELKDLSGAVHARMLKYFEVGRLQTQAASRQ